ncbi:MAG: 2-oxoacid:acceptor oxidoreductase family protein [Spirochaetales bacterium]|nr:2-oxoacid:acceptor oxidoreductase family protein [Spirochaetales bacterium]
MIKHKKPTAFYETFERKGHNDTSTHYCPGCGHGTVHKFIAEAIDDLGVKDQVVFLSPVGCSVFAYYYFDAGNIQCSHGRAPAVATGVRRVHKDAVIISYQGDGDLAGIGTSEIIHAANRGENITVFFVNNAIYGMTGGQMAPTTLNGQKTLTTPLGRDPGRDGLPIGMAEIMNAITAPVYIERVSLSSTKGVLKTRKAVRKGLKNQIDGRGFSFIEILSPCPVNWKMDPVEAREWIAGNLEPVFPITCFRDACSQDQKDSQIAVEHSVESDQIPFMDDKELVSLLKVDALIPNLEILNLEEDQLVKIAGFGGQGVLSGGVLLAKCGIAEGIHATWLPSYGPEMRGGRAYASVILANDEIGSPVVDEPNVLIAMNGPSLDAFEDDVVPGGFILVNSSIATRKVKRDDVSVLYIPASDIAKKEGLTAAANVVLLTIYLKHKGIMSTETLRKIIPVSVTRKKFINTNLRIMDKALEYYDNNVRI